MAKTPDQARPLAPAAGRRVSSDGDESSSPRKTRRRRRWVKCCAIAAAFILIQVTVIVALIFTVFKVKDPVIQMNSIAVPRPDLSGTTTPRPGSNMTLDADVSVKNPNYASFRYQNTMKTIYYRGVVIGEARGPPGRARARRAMRVNVNVNHGCDDGSCHLAARFGVGKMCTVDKKDVFCYI